MLHESPYYDEITELFSWFYDIVPKVHSSKLD